MPDEPIQELYGIHETHILRLMHPFTSYGIHANDFLVIVNNAVHWDLGPCNLVHRTEVLEVKYFHILL